LTRIFRDALTRHRRVPGRRRQPAAGTSQGQRQEPLSATP